MRIGKSVCTCCGYVKWVWTMDTQSCLVFSAWWRHQMETFSALLAICAGNSPVPGEFPTQRPVTRSFDVYFDLRPNKRLSKQSWGWWFETLSWSLWRHCNGDMITHPCPNFSGGLNKPPSKLGHGWVITFHIFIMMWLPTHTVNSIWFG